MILGAWGVLVGLAALFTVGWLHVDPDRSVQATGGLAFVFWALSAIGARNLTVASGGATLDVGSDAIAVGMLIPSILSALAVAAARAGVYPPETDNQTIQGVTND